MLALSDGNQSPNPGIHTAFAPHSFEAFAQRDRNRSNVAFASQSASALATLRVGHCLTTRHIPI